MVFHIEYKLHYLMPFLLHFLEQNLAIPTRLGITLNSAPQFSHTFITAINNNFLKLIMTNIEIIIEHT